METRIIYLEEKALFFLIDTLYERLKQKEKGAKWINGTEAMRLLNVTSATTMQKLRDSGDLRISQISKKLILYDRASIEEFLEKRARR